MIKNKPQPSADRDVSLSQQGDLDAFRRLVESHQQYAFSLAFRMLGNSDDAEDVVQEAFVRIWKHIGEFDFRCKFTTWMYRIVTNLCHDIFKQKKRHSHALLSAVALESDNFEDKGITEELANLVITVSGHLPPKQRKVFVLRDLQDLSVAEVAEILGISKSSVKANLCYARQNIRKLLEDVDKTGRCKHEM